jgi:hypothetical protein
MSDEPRYVDPDDPFEDRQAAKDKKNLNGIDNLDLLARMRGATGRKATNDFATAREKRRYLLIERQNKNGLTPDGWLDFTIEWVASYNRKHDRIRIMFPKLQDYILNKAKMQDWINKQPAHKVSMEKYSDPDAFD